MNIAEYIDSKFPSRTFKVLINGDYSIPSEFATMKSEFTKAYNVIDGVALHTYTGYDDASHNIANLKDKIDSCANNFNPLKKYVQCSELTPSKAYNGNKVYMEAANIIPDIIHIYARAGVKAAAYWPPINSSIPGLGLMNYNYSTILPCGQILADMAADYKGHAISTTATGMLKASAARPDSNTIVLYVPGKDLSTSVASVKV